MRAELRVPSKRPKPADAGEPGRLPDDSPDLGGVVETALAEALGLAARAGQWSVVERLAAELEARRLRREGSSAAPVVTLKGQAR